MIIEYNSRTYRITYQSVSMVENALENPNLIQITVSSGCTIMVAKNDEYGIGYLPNGEYRSWKLKGINTKLNRIAEHFIYARLSRESEDALIVFSVNDYAIDGSIDGGDPSTSYYYYKIGKITSTDALDDAATINREITFDYGYLSTPAASEGAYAEWKDLFEVTAENLIRPLKRFASFVVEGTLSLIGKLVINEKPIADIARQSDEGDIPNSDEVLPTAALIQGKLRDIYLNKDREDSTEHEIGLFGGTVIKKLARFGQFVTGISGGMIDENGDMEMRSGYFRKRLFVPELAYNRITYFKGRAVLSPGGGCKVKSYIKNEDGSYTVTPDLTDADALSQFKDDILSAFFTTKNEEGKLTGFAQMQFRVTEADYDAKTFKMVNKPGETYEPGEEMVLAQTGNFSDEERQTYILFDTVNGNNCITFFDHANTWDPEPAQMPAWFGKKKGMKIAGIDCDNYSAVLQNILLTGLIFQIDEITGDSVRVPIDKGEWIEDTNYGYYDRVSHNGALWLCVSEEATKEEPGMGNAWLKQVSEGAKGEPGLSVVGGGHWESSKTPYKANTLVSFYNCVFISNKETSNPPIAIARYKDGSFIRQKNGGYILAGKSADFTVHPDWTMLLDGRELQGKSITFLGSFDTAPSNPAEGNSYYNTTDKCTYVYQNGVWMLMVSDGKDGRDYEYIYTRNNSIGIIPDKPDSKQQDDYVPEGWTDDFLGVSETFQVEWGCKRTKRDGIWSEWSTPAIVHRWSKDGENAVIADLDNEMVNCALTSEGKVSKAQSWVTNVAIWYGYESLPLESISTTQPSGITVSANKDTGAVTVSVAQNVVLSDTNDVVITLTATKNGQNFERKLTFTIAGVRAGENGQDAVLYSLLPSASSIVKYKDGSYNISTISCRRQKTVGGTISDTTEGTLKYSLDGGSETSISDNTGIATSSIKKSVKFLFYVNEKLVDVETIPLLSDGKDGESGKGVSKIDVYYYLSTSPTELKGGTWVTEAPEWVDGKFIWEKTITFYSDGSTVETPSVCLTGSTGATGVGIERIEEYYYLSDSPVSLTGGTWVSESPEWVNGKYLWTKTIIYYTDSTKDETTPICVSGPSGLSVIGGGHWESSKVPYQENTLVSFYNCVFISNVKTSNPPIAIARYKDGSYIRTRLGGYILAGKSADFTVHPDWTMLLDGRELQGKSITFLGSFPSAPSNPKEGESYYNTTDRCTYVYQSGVWMLMVSDGKDAKDYEYIYTRNNSESEKPSTPDSKQQDDYVPEGWTDDFLGVSETFQVEWGCKRTKRDGVWSEWSTPAIVHRWSKDGENAVIADLDNEMVNCALTSEGKVSKAQSWVTNVAIWYGYESLPLESISTTQPSGITVTSNKDTGAVTVSVAQGVSLAETNNVVITLTATKNGQNFERNLTFTIAGVRAGENGQDAVLYSLLPSASSIVKYKDGSYDISSISCKRQKTVGGTISDTTDGTLKYSLDGGPETDISDNTGIATSSIKKSVKFLFYVNEKLVDVETIPVVTDGSDGKGIASSDVMFYLSNSSTSLSGGSWVTNAPAWVDGKYYWSKTVITYTDGTQTETKPVCISGGKGPSGNGISKVEEQYYQSDSRTSLTGGSWSTTSPAWKEGKYIWTRTAIYFTNGEVSYTSAICAAGQDGTSVTAVGHWVSSKVPYYKNNLVNFGRGTFVALKDTSNPPLPIARFKDGTYMRMKDGGYILSGKFADMQVNADWQMMSWGEESETLYWLDCPISAFSLTSTGSASPSSVEVTCKQSKSGNVSSCADLWLAARRYNGSWVAHVNAIKAPSIGVSAVSGYTQYSVRAYRNQSDANAWNENYVTEKGIAVSEQGIQGINGAFPYDRGVYKSGNSYVWNQNRRDKVICLIDGVYYNFLVKNYGATVTAKPSSAGGDSNWEAMQRYDSIVTDTFFADGANIAGLMFKLKGYTSAGIPYGEVQSQNTDGNGTPMLYINTQTGYFYCSNATVKGAVTATSGKIGGWNINGNNLECSGYNTKILVEASGTRFMRINAEERVMCYIRSDESTGISASVYGSTDDAVGINVLCNSMGKGFAIKSYGNVFLNARQSEHVQVYGLSIQVRKVSSSGSLYSNDDFIEFANASEITFNMSTNAVTGKVVYMKKVSTGADVTLTGRFRNHGDVGISTSGRIGDEVSRMFVFDGTYWVQFYCG